MTNLSPRSPTQTFKRKFCHLDVEWLVSDSQTHLSFIARTIKRASQLLKSKCLRNGAVSASTHVPAQFSCAHTAIVNISALVNRRKYSLSSQCVPIVELFSLDVVLVDRLIDVFVIEILAHSVLVISALALDRHCSATMFDVNLHCVLC